MSAETARVDLYWLPLGAGGHSVRLNGRVFEAVVARLERRPARDLYHSALVVGVPEGTYVIEQAPVRDGTAGSAASSRKEPSEAAGLARCASSATRSAAGASGVIPDVGEAVDSPQRLTDDPVACPTRSRARARRAHARLGARRARDG